MWKRCQLGGQRCRPAAWHSVMQSVLLVSPTVSHCQKPPEEYVQAEQPGCGVAAKRKDNYVAYFQIFLFFVSRKPKWRNFGPSLSPSHLPAPVTVGAPPISSEPRWSSALEGAFSRAGCQQLWQRGAALTLTPNLCAEPVVGSDKISLNSCAEDLLKGPSDQSSLSGSKLPWASENSHILKGGGSNLQCWG